MLHSCPLLLSNTTEECSCSLKNIAIDSRVPGYIGNRFVDLTRQVYLKRLTNDTQYTSNMQLGIKVKVKLHLKLFILIYTHHPLYQFMSNQQIISQQNAYNPADTGHQLHVHVKHQNGNNHTYMTAQ